MKQADFVLGVNATVLSTIGVMGVSWLYIEKKVRYITTDDNVQ